MAKELEKLYDNPFYDENLVEMVPDEFEFEFNNLIEWFEDLDYEKYTENWLDKVISSKPEAYQTTIEAQPYKITTTELGGFILKMNPQIMALQQELSAQGISIGSWKLRRLKSPSIYPIDDRPKHRLDPKRANDGATIAILITTQYS